MEKMNLEAYQILTEPQIIDFIEKNLGKKSADLALSRKANAAITPLVYSQVKNLQKSEKKLPNYYRARAILPTRAFEQCSSEATAALKDISGDRFLDLTCGLGVDSLYLSKKFKSGTSLEADPVLAAVTTHNFKQMGISSVEVLSQRAEDFLSTYQGKPFDLIYVDPDRRDEQGNRQVLLEKLQPNILKLMPLIRQHSRRLLIKLSPLFDLSEAERLFEKDLTRLAVISVDNECKEVWVDCLFDQGKDEPITQVKTLRKGELTDEIFAWKEEEKTLPFEGSWETFIQQYPNTKYILEPDVAFYKSRKTLALKHRLLDGKGHMNHPKGYIFTVELPPQTFSGRVFEIVEALPFRPKNLKKKWSKTSLHVSKRYAPMSVKEIRKRTGIREGGDQYLLCTKWGKRMYAFLANPISLYLQL